jgi:hypothetical protein
MLVLVLLESALLISDFHLLNSMIPFVHSLSLCFDSNHSLPIVLCIFSYSPLRAGSYHFLCFLLLNSLNLGRPIPIHP